MSSEYEAFVATKTRRAQPAGIAAPVLNASLFPMQQDLVRWSLRLGRAAIFAATGLGKSRMECEWARRIVDHSGKPVIILTPLAVAAQMVEEGRAIGVDVALCKEACDVRPGVNVINYDRIHKIDTSVFGGVVLDESSVIKHSTSKTLGLLMEAFRETPFRLSATATPAPNDYTELGTQAEFLGVCTQMEMLSEFFVHDGGETQVWRLKRHAAKEFWRWVSSWAALVRRPSDLGYPDDSHILPPLHIHQHVVPTDTKEAWGTGNLFVVEAHDLSERRAARKASVSRRVQACADVVNASPDVPWIVWGDLNAETDALTRAIPGAVEVRGSDDPEDKEERMLRFTRGEIRVLVSKSSICGWGMNWQHCAHQAFAGVTDSWEAYYQAVRRSWRFRQTRPVHVHIFSSEAEGAVVANLKRKEADAERMAEELSAQTRESVLENVRGHESAAVEYEAKMPIQIPSWITEDQEAA